MDGGLVASGSLVTPVFNLMVKAEFFNEAMRRWQVATIFPKP
jgi:hypothetical protein